MITDHYSREKSVQKGEEGQSALGRTFSRKHTTDRLTQDMETIWRDIVNSAEKFAKEFIINNNE
jgi:ATP-dependent Zn protease